MWRCHLVFCFWSVNSQTWIRIIWQAGKQFLVGALRRVFLSFGSQIRRACARANVLLIRKAIVQRCANLSGCSYHVASTYAMLRGFALKRVPLSLGKHIRSAGCCFPVCCRCYSRFSFFFGPRCKARGHIVNRVADNELQLPHLGPKYALRIYQHPNIHSTPHPISPDKNKHMFGCDQTFQVSKPLLRWFRLLNFWHQVLSSRHGAPTVCLAMRMARDLKRNQAGAVPLSFRGGKVHEWILPLIMDHESSFPPFL